MVRPVLLSVAAWIGLACTGCNESFTTFEVGIAGVGRVTSADGAIDCVVKEASSPAEGRCSFTANVTTTLTLQAIPADGAVVRGWGLSTSTDCASCDSGDPPTGSLSEAGDLADVTIDVNDGYQGAETVTVSFAPAGS